MRPRRRSPPAGLACHVEYDRQERRKERSYRRQGSRTCQAGGLSRTRADRVDANLAILEIEDPAPGQPANRGLGGGVDDVRVPIDPIALLRPRADPVPPKQVPKVGCLFLRPAFPSRGISE